MPSERTSIVETPFGCRSRMGAAMIVALEYGSSSVVLYLSSPSIALGFDWAHWDPRCKQIPWLANAIEFLG